MQVLRAAGVQTESELPFAAAHQLLRPALGHLGVLPESQHDALAGALALGPAQNADRFVVSAAVLTLLSEYAGPQGLLCVVDDAQWVDRPSLDALFFAARRLDAEGVCLLFGWRDEGQQTSQLDSLPRLDLRAFDTHEAADVIADSAGFPVSAVVVGQLMTLFGGNALALTELGRSLTRDELTGRAPLPDPLPMSAGMENTFLGRVRTLAPEVQLLLLVTAAEDTGALRTVLGAAETLGIEGTAALDVAEGAGLLTVVGQDVQFRHPLVRSAVYGGAPSRRRRAVHDALVAVLEHDGEADRCAWHRAAAAWGPDQRVADDLAASAERARARSAYATAAAFSERAASLTPDGGPRAGRLVGSARDRWVAGQPELAYACLSQAGQLEPPAELRDEILELHGLFELRRGDATKAYRIFVEAAENAADRAPSTALRMLGEAVKAALYVGDPEGVVTAGRRAASLHPGDVEAELARELSVGLAHVFAGDLNAAQPSLRRVIRDAESSATPNILLSAGFAAMYLGELPLCHDLFTRAASTARVADMTGDLPYVLEYLANIERWRGRLATSQAVSEEGLRLARDTGQETSEAVHLASLALVRATQGDDSGCREHAEAALAIALPRSLGLAAARAFWALGLLDLGEGRFADASTRLRELASAGPGVGHPAITLLSLPDRVEAAVQAGELEEAATALKALEDWSTRSGSSVAVMVAVVTRCRALLATAGAKEALFIEAVELHGQGHSPPPDVARTHLLYGEWLRRERRPADSRAHLRTAMEAFERLGSEPWAQRARLELRATGETTRTRDVTSTLRLTPQELRIARLVAEGRSTRDVAATLFLSPRTVEYHLYKLYPKLGITSRVELVRILAENPQLIDHFDHVEVASGR
jgi:DNA-binding CsgD family transcriptional regulator